MIFIDKNDFFENYEHEGKLLVRTRVGMFYYGSIEGPHGIMTIEEYEKYTIIYKKMKNEIRENKLNRILFT